MSLGISRRVAKASLTFTVTYIVKVERDAAQYYTLVPQVECGKMSPITCSGIYTNDEGASKKLRDTFTFPGDKLN